MKLNEDIKKRIDEYYDNISAEQLYSLLVDKYGFIDTEIMEINEVDEIPFYFINTREIITIRYDYQNMDYTSIYNSDNQFHLLEVEKADNLTGGDSFTLNDISLSLAS